jgi:chorismate mutase-like protein
MSRDCRRSAPSPAARLRAAAIVALSLALGAASAQELPASASRLDRIRAAGVLRLGTPGDYPPFSARAGGGFVGLDIALAEGLAQALGVRLEIVPTSWPALMADFAAGRFDLAMGGISVSPERRKAADFSIPYLRDGKTPLARCADAGRYRTLAEIDRPEVRLVVNPGGTNERFARAHAPHAALTVAPDNAAVFERLADGQADVMITDAIEARLRQRLHPTLCAVHPEAPFDVAEKAVLLPRDEALKAFVDRWLSQEIADGAPARLEERWLAYPWGLEPLRRLIDERLLLARDVAQFKWNRRLPIEDRAREAQVIADLGRRAEALGVPRDGAERFFRAQIEASKIAQADLFRGWGREGRGSFPDAPDLAAATRPRLDALTEKLLRALAENWPLLADPGRRPEVERAMRPMAAEAIGADAVDAAIAPLLH